MVGLKRVRKTTTTNPARNIDSCDIPTVLTKCFRLTKMINALPPASMKFLSTLLIATWLLCWVHCWTEQSAGGNDGCCGSFITECQSQTPAWSAPDHAAAEFDCVQGIFAKGISLADKLAVAPVIHTELPAGYFLVVNDRADTSGLCMEKIPREPPFCWRLWEFMARTASPVRGPTLIA